MPCLRLSLLALSFAAGSAAAAPIDGLWCGTGLLNEFSLRLAQQDAERVAGTLTRRQRVRELTGSIDGNIVRTQSTKVGSLVLEVRGNALHVVDGDGQLVLLRGMSFARSGGNACS